MKRLNVIILVFTTAGLLFSGYMSAVKLFSGTCAFNESCPYFLGYPACWYGFAMYAAMFVATLGGLLQWFNRKTMFGFDAGISALGIIFSGSFIVEEAATSSLVGGPLAFSTCVYGFVFYTAIFITAMTASKKYSLPTI